MEDNRIFYTNYTKKLTAPYHKNKGVVLFYSLSRLYTMQLTTEQGNIIEAEGNIKINAVAGSGKTTTLVAYAKRRHLQHKILYIAFNKSVRLEALQKFSQEKVQNINIETAHSLAYNYTMRQGKYKLVQGYKSPEVKDLLELQPIKNELNSEYILANHVLRYSQYFCNQTTQKVQELNYLALLEEGGEAYKFVKEHYDTILYYTRLFLAKMQRAEISITHDFYLKKFQLFCPKLPYDTILFDEGQDASPVILDTFLKQDHADKVIVGDQHQQIYAWRFAVNALQQVDFEAFQLSHSFRFADDIAFLAKYFLGWKKLLNQPEQSQIIGLGKCQTHHRQAILARRNITLLKKAIEYISQNPQADVYFEGNFSSYTYASESASIYDVLNLFLGKRYAIKDRIIRQTPDFTHLEEYAEKIEDTELLMLIEMVKTYKKDLPYWLNQIRKKHVEDYQRVQAHMIFSTVHKCKGLEYDEVFLAEDFITEAEIKRMIFEQGLNPVLVNKLIEEINILYVATTRTKNILHLPKKYLPEDLDQTWQSIKVPIVAENANRIPKIEDLPF